MKKKDNIINERNAYCTRVYKSCITREQKEVCLDWYNRLLEQAYQFKLRTKKEIL